MQGTRYQSILLLQYLFLLVDLFMNTATEMLRLENVVLLILHVIQDLCVLFALIVMFLMFFNTYIFQAGLISILVNKFRLPITVTFIYLILCVSLHVWSLTIRWVDPEIYIWETTGYRALYVFQRSGAVLYYYFYKRTALKLGDLRFYQKSDWIKEEFENRR